MALYLYNCNINTEDDLAEWILDDGNAESLLEINGVGRKTIDYMKLLSGQQAIPIDRHMFQFLEIAGVLTADYKEASRILRKTASVLEVGESVLDKTIWNYMSQKSQMDRCRFLIYSEILWYNISESLNYQTESMRLTLKIMNRRDIMCIE